MTTTLVASNVIGPRWEWGDRLRKIRRSIADLSQPQMAALLGIRATTYAAWEAGRTQPSHRIAQAVAQRIESQYPDRVSAAWVLGVGGENTTSDEVLLPRMDSNHQPCDLCHQTSDLLGQYGVSAGQLCFCDLSHSCLEITCTSDLARNDYQTQHADGKGHNDFGVSAVFSWGGVSS